MTAAVADLDRQRAVESLGRSIEAELGLLDELAQGLVAQREAIAADDTPRLEQLGQQLSRTLLTLREARRQRVVLVELMAGQPDARLAEVLGGLVAESAERVRDLAGRLRQAAAAVSRELQINQTVIRRSIDSGERLLQHLLSAPTPEAYGQRAASPRDAVLLNQRA